MHTHNYIDVHESRGGAQDGSDDEALVAAARRETVIILDSRDMDV